MLTKQDHGVAGESVYARPGHELPEAQRPDVLPDLQPHPHHRRHVLHHLRNQSRGLRFRLFVITTAAAAGANWVFFFFALRHTGRRRLPHFHQRHHVLSAAQ